MSKEGVLINARRLVQEAVDIADRAGIDPYTWSRRTVRKPQRLKLMGMVEVQTI